MRCHAKGKLLRLNGNRQTFVTEVDDAVLQLICYWRREQAKAQLKMIDDI